MQVPISLGDTNNPHNHDNDILPDTSDRSIMSSPRKKLMIDVDEAIDHLNNSGNAGYQCTCGAYEARMKRLFSPKAQRCANVQDAQFRIVLLSTEIDRLLTANTKLVKQNAYLQSVGGQEDKIKDLEGQVALLAEENDNYAKQIEEYK